MSQKRELFTTTAVRTKKFVDLNSALEFAKAHRGGGEGAQLRENHDMGCEIRAQTQARRETTENFHRVGRSRDLPDAN